MPTVACVSIRNMVKVNHSLESNNFIISVNIVWCILCAQAAGLVYMHLNSKEKHELLLGSSHFTPFMHYLISKKLMKSLVTKTLQLNR